MCIVQSAEKRGDDCRMRKRARDNQTMTNQNNVDMINHQCSTTSPLFFWVGRVSLRSASAQGEKERGDKDTCDDVQNTPVDVCGVV